LCAQNAGFFAQKFWIVQFSYTLFFQDEPVNPDEQESWLGLTLQGPNEAYIDARIIEESKAENAPAGTYSDTIRVSITPFDTI